jgi:endonuclease/exonuclease/phosphatase family metal-dependent hydrolase
LVPALIWRDRKQLLPLAAIGLLMLGPVFGFCVPWRSLLPGQAGGPTLRFLSWNVEEERVDARSLSTLLEKERPDVAVLQECHHHHLTVPGGWHARRDYGLCLLSRFPIRDVVARDPSDALATGESGQIVRYVLATPAGDVHVTNVHLETPREGLEEILHGNLSGGVRLLVAKNRQRSSEAGLARSWADQAGGPARIVAGDFNTPPQSNLMREFWSDYANCFGVAGLGFGYTKHTRRIRVRIDHVLAGPGWKCQAAWVTHWPGPDHDPVIADLRWAGAGTR